MKYDFPNIVVEVLRRYIVGSSEPDAAVFARVQRALDDGDINAEEARRLLDTPRPHRLINSRGGSA